MFEEFSPLADGRGPVQWLPSFNGFGEIRFLAIAPALRMRIGIRRILQMDLEILQIQDGFPKL